MQNNLDLCEEDAIHIPTSECTCAGGVGAKYARNRSNSVVALYGEGDIRSIAFIDFKTPGIYRVDGVYSFDIDTVPDADSSPVGLFNVCMMNLADFDIVNPTFAPYSAYVISDYFVIPNTGTAYSEFSWIVTPGADSDLMQYIVAQCYRLRNGVVPVDRTGGIQITVTRLGDLDELALGTDIVIAPTELDR